MGQFGIDLSFQAESNNRNLVRDESNAQRLPCLSWLEKTQPVISEKSFFIFEQEAELEG